MLVIQLIRLNIIVNNNNLYRHIKINEQKISIEKLTGRQTKVSNDIKIKTYYKFSSN